MKVNVKNIAADYYSEIQRALKSGSINVAKLNLDDNIRIIKPRETFEGKKAVEEMFKTFISMMHNLGMVNLDIKRQYFDEESCCTILDGVVELMLIKNRKVVEIHFIFDAAAWK